MRIILTLTLIFLLAPFSHGQKLPLLKVSDNGHYIVNQRGTPFFWLGGTAWEMIHRLNRGDVDLYLEDRAAKGFTIIQTVILAELDGLNTPNTSGHKPLINNDPTKPNEKYFEHVDYVIKKAEKLGLYIGLLPTWGDKFNLKWGAGPVIFTPENAEIYGEFLAKRYLKQTNIVWILGGDRIPENEEQYKIIRAMARGIRKIDSIHLMTYHPVGAKKATDLFNDDWLDLDMFQSGHSRNAKEYNYVIESRKIEPTRPVIEAEARYENIPESFWEPGEHEWMDDWDVRQSAYWTLIAGAAGYTYGCNDIWQMYAIDKEPNINARTGWKEALQLPGSRQMLFMKQLFSSLPWQKMIYDPSLIINDNPENQEYITSAIGKNKDFIIAYTPFGKPISINISKMKSSSVKAYWFNPRSGETLLIGNFKSTDKTTFTPWASGRGSDFVLIILDESSEIKLPSQSK